MASPNYCHSKICTLCIVFWSKANANGFECRPAMPATMSKQRSTLLPKTATMSNEFIVKFCPFDKVETDWACSICFDFVERTKFRSTLLPKTATVSKQHSTLSKVVRIVAFDNVASTLLLVWTALQCAYSNNLTKLPICSFINNVRSSGFIYKFLFTSHEPNELKGTGVRVPIAILVFLQSRKYNTNVQFYFQIKLVFYVINNYKHCNLSFRRRFWMIFRLTYVFKKFYS